MLGAGGEGCLLPPHVRHPGGGLPSAGMSQPTPPLLAPLFSCTPLCQHPLSAGKAPASTWVQGQEGVPPSACVWWGWGQLPGGWHCPGAHPQGKQLRALQPYVLSCCYSADGSVVAKTFQVLRDLVDQLPWQHSAAFLIQLAFTLPPFLEEVCPLRPVSLLGRRLSSNGVARTVSKALWPDGDACGPRPGDGPEGRGQSQWGCDAGGSGLLSGRRGSTCVFSPRSPSICA